MNEVDLLFNLVASLCHKI